MINESLIEIMIDVGIALYGGGDPYHRLRIAKRNAKPGTSHYRTVETLLKQNKTYLYKAIGAL